MPTPLILPVRGYRPQIHETVFLAPNATVVGDVTLGPHCSVWFNAAVRGDFHLIRISAYANIQGSVILHGTYKKADLHISERVSIWHNACVHGCTIKTKFSSE
jgi:carbonic anhydrase/acetyltransferase-like protein (isoleucine patch superfamily)